MERDINTIKEDIEEIEKDIEQIRCNFVYKFFVDCYKQ